VGRVSSRTPDVFGTAGQSCEATGRRSVNCTISAREAADQTLRYDEDPREHESVPRNTAGDELERAPGTRVYARSVAQRSPNA